MDSLRNIPGGLGASSYWGDANPGPKDRVYTWAEGIGNCETSISFPFYFGGYSLKDADIVKTVYDRHPDWQNSLIVMDVTGSMSPYIAKTMAWVKSEQTEAQIKAFTFFNDGDYTPDHLKVTGNVGGVYSVDNTDFKSVYKEMKSTMRRGGGGDCPENNIEATLKGLQLYPRTDKIIMVADNLATPRDLAYVRDLNKPVHIIVCGAHYGINTNYLQLAYDTGGSVHTIEEDLDLKGIKPGKTLKIGKFYFTVLDGKIMKDKHR